MESKNHARMPTQFTNLISYIFEVLSEESSFLSKKKLQILQAIHYFAIITIPNRICEAFLELLLKSTGIETLNIDSSINYRFLWKSVLFSKSSNNFKSKQLLTSPLINAIPLWCVYLIIIFFTSTSCCLPTKCHRGKKSFQTSGN